MNSVKLERFSDLDDVDVLYLEDGNAYRPVKNKTATMFFSKKLF